MTVSKLKELDILLREYMNDMAKADTENKRLYSEDSYSMIHLGSKAQYNHARCISRKIELLIEHNMYAGWGMGEKDSEGFECD